MKNMMTPWIQRSISTNVSHRGDLRHIPNKYSQSSLLKAGFLWIFSLGNPGSLSKKCSHFLIGKSSEFHHYKKSRGKYHLPKGVNHHFLKNHGNDFQGFIFLLVYFFFGTQPVHQFVSGGFQLSDCRIEYLERLL